MSGPGRTLDAASIRGLAVLVVAVLLGFILLSRSEDLAPSVEARSDRPTSTTVPAPSSTLLTPLPSSTTTPTGDATSTRPAAEVNVIVLNASGGLARGVAGTMTEKLTDLEYQTVEPGNAVARDTSVVYFAEGFEAEATAIQQGLGLPGTVEPLADLPTAEAQGADIVVVLGGDAASLVDDGGAVDPGTPTTFSEDGSDVTTPLTDATTGGTDTDTDTGTTDTGTTDTDTGRTDTTGTAED